MTGESTLPVTLSKITDPSPAESTPTILFSSSLSFPFFLGKLIVCRLSPLNGRLRTSSSKVFPVPGVLASMCVIGLFSKYGARKGWIIIATAFVLLALSLRGRQWNNVHIVTGWLRTDTSCVPSVWESGWSVRGISVGNGLSRSSRITSSAIRAGEGCRTISRNYRKEKHNEKASGSYVLAVCFVL